MLYNYGAVVNFDPKAMESVLEYFISKKDSFYDVLEEIEYKHSLLQTDFDIFHPNITFQIGSYIFDKEEYYVDLGSNIELLVNDTLSNFESSGISREVDDRTVLASSRIADGKIYLDNIFLTRDSLKHTVYWYYDLDSPDLQFNADTIFNDYDILPVTSIAARFYMKMYETFSDLRILGHDATNEMSVMNKTTLEREYNNIQDVTVICNPVVTTGDTISVENDSFIFINKCAISSNTITFPESYSLSDMSPVPTDYGYNNFGRSDLTNFSSFTIIDNTYQERMIKEVVSLSNVIDSTIDTLEKDTTSIDDAYKISISGGE